MICLFFLPIVCITPDIAFTMFQKVFYPTPTDWVMIQQKKNPGFCFEGFDNVFIPQLPVDSDDKLIKITTSSKIFYYSGKIKQTTPLTF